MLIQVSEDPRISYSSNRRSGRVDGERRSGGVDAGKDVFGASSNKEGTNRAVKKILSTLGLKLPNLIISIDKTDGDSIEG